MANNKIQVKRTNVSGRTANVTSSGNAQYIDAGELALNMADGILYTSNGSSLITVGANQVNQRITNSLTLDNDKQLRFKTVNTSAYVGMRQQSDDNFVFYTTNTAYGERAIWAVYANTVNSAFNLLAPLKVEAGIVANGSYGNAGQTLFSSGGGVYWGSGAGTGTVTQVDSGNGLTGGPITSTGTLSVQANSGIVANSTGVFVNSAYIATLAANSASYLGGNTASDLRNYSDTVAGTAYSNAVSNAANDATNKAANAYSNAVSNAANDATNKAANAYSNAVAYVDGKSYVNSSQLSSNLANYQTTAGLSANVATLTANNTSFVGSVSAANVVSNAQLSSNLANYATTTNLTNNLANYQTTAGLSANVATLTANSADYVKANNGITSNSSGVFVTQGDGTTVNSTGVHVRAGNTQLISNSTGVWANQANFDHNSLSNYDANKHVDHTAVTFTAGAGLTGGGTIAASRTFDVGAANGITVSADAVGVNAGNTLTVNSTGVHVNSTLQLTTLTTSGNVVIEGNLTVSGNVVVIGANNLSLVDNFIYLNSNNTTQNIDLGFAGNYNDGTYKHAGFFRDATDGFWKPFDGYTPEPDAAVDIDTSNNTFNIAGMWFGNTRIGNTTVYATINSSIYSATANNANNLGGTAAASFVQNTDSRTLSGNLNFTGTNNYFTGMVTFSNTSSQSNTTAAAWFNSSVGTVAFDTNMVKRISWNDGAGNFNMRGGVYYNGAALVYNNDGTSGGGATISLNVDAQDGSITLNTWPIGVGGATVSGGASAYLNTSAFGIVSGNLYAGSLLVANSTVVNATHLTGYTFATPPVIGSGTANGASLTYANVSGQVNTATFYATTSANVGANVQLTTSLLFIGNSTVNADMTSSLVQVTNSTSTANLTATGLQTYTSSTVNSTVSATTISIANSTANALIVPTSITVQNSTVNSVLGLNSLLIQSNTTVNSSISNTTIQVANSSGNVQIIATQVKVANSTGTANLNATSLVIGNTTIQTTNAIFGGTIAANGGIGSAGQVLTSGGSGNVYWTTVSGVNTSAQYTWSNVHSFSNVVYLATTAGSNVGIGTTSPSYKLQVNGSFAATTKSFVINHPTKPDMKLRYGSLEGPENGVYVRGRVQGPYIYLPEHWEGLVDENSITVSLTPIAKTQMPSVLSFNNQKIVLHSDTPIDCFYHVFGERKDVEKLLVEF